MKGLCALLRKIALKITIIIIIIIKFPLAIRGVGELCANDASLKISGQLIKHLRRRISRRMELKAFFMSSFARMKFGDNSGGMNCGFACIFYRNTELKGPQKI